MEVPAAAPGEAVELAARCTRHLRVGAVELPHVLPGALVRECPVPVHRLTGSTSSQRAMVPMLPLLHVRATRPTLGNGRQKGLGHAIVLDHHALPGSIAHEGECHDAEGGRPEKSYHSMTLPIPVRQ